MSVARSLLLVQELDSHLVKRFLHHVTRNAAPRRRLVSSVRGAGLRSLHCGAPALQGLGAGSTPPNAETITSFRSPASYRRVHAARATPQEEELFESSRGPDQVLPARSHKCWHPDGAVTITMDEEGPGARAPMSVHSLLQTAVLTHPQQRALAVHRAIMAGGLSTGLYHNNSAEASCGIANDCRAQVLVLDDHHTVSNIMTVRHKLPHVKAIVQWLGQPRERGVMSWAEFMHLGASTPDDELQQRLSLQAVNQCCTLIYTSGTTGPPKGVMCSQDNITWSARAIVDFFSLKHDDSIVSYLPLNHIAAQMVDLYLAMTAAGTVYFAKPDALKGSLFDTIKDVRLGSRIDDGVHLHRFFMYD
ncbi:long-chain-fatty-acid--CoA ligase ACSBG2-like [Hyalella azteca]|uniref:long-chain-fatty-acid--CoA ligase n=1 Tax=Hyalella azteca TaxID=294128 RepID=A0A8B7N4B6_HYAAZ|nr:long-chain-fatty-acid--CoA ligase ACSBG2-like [Hyalella azteca]